MRDAGQPPVEPRVRSGPVSGLTAGLRRAWPLWLLGIVCFVLAIPAYADLEGLLTGLGVIALLIAVAITVFSARSRSE